MGTNPGVISAQTAIIKGLHTVAYIAMHNEENRMTPYNDLIVGLSCKEYIVLSKLETKSFRFIL